MIDALSFAITLGCLLTALVVAGRAAAGRFAWRPATRAVVVLEAALVVQAVLDLVALAGGHRPRELSTHLSYLAFAVLVLPYALLQTRDDSGRWSGALLAVALLATGVLVIRLQTTWRSAPA